MKPFTLNDIKHMYRTVLESNPFESARNLGSLETILIIQGKIKIGEDLPFKDIPVRYNRFMGFKVNKVEKETYEMFILRLTNDLIIELDS